MNSWVGKGGSFAPGKNVNKSSIGLQDEKSSEDD